MSYYASRPTYRTMEMYNSVHEKRLERSMTIKSKCAKICSPAVRRIHVPKRKHRREEYVNKYI